jgi:hypothetical protein
MTQISPVLVLFGLVLKIIFSFDQNQTFSTWTSPATVTVPIKGKSWKFLPLTVTSTQASVVVEGVKERIFGEYLKSVYLEIAKFKDA